MYINEMLLNKKKKKASRKKKEQICNTLCTHMVGVFLSHAASLASCGFGFFFHSSFLHVICSS